MSLTQHGTVQDRGTRGLLRGRRALLAACASLLLAFVSPHAAAHAIVEKSTPQANAIVAPGPLAVTIVFNTRLDRARSRLALEAPDGAVTPIALDANTPATAIGGRGEVTSEGQWKLRWQVLATDGHITRGEIPFVVRFAKENR